MAQKTYKYFDLDSMKMIGETVDIPEFKSSETLEEAMKRAGDEKAVIKAIDGSLKRSVLREAKVKVTSKGADRGVVLNFIKPFRLAGEFAAIEDRDAQTDAILAKIAGDPFLKSVVKAASDEAAKNPDDDSENDGE